MFLACSKGILGLVFGNLWGAWLLTQQEGFVWGHCRISFAEESQEFRGIFVKKWHYIEVPCAAWGQGDRPSEGNDGTFPESPFSFWGCPFPSHTFAGQSQPCSLGLLSWHRDHGADYSALCIWGCMLTAWMSCRENLHWEGQPRVPWPELFFCLPMAVTQWGMSCSGLCRHQAFSPMSTEEDFSIDHGPSLSMNCQEIFRCRSQSSTLSEAAIGRGGRRES